MRSQMPVRTIGQTRQDVHDVIRRDMQLLPNAVPRELGFGARRAHKHFVERADPVFVRWTLIFALRQLRRDARHYELRMWAVRPELPHASDGMTWDDASE